MSMPGYIARALLRFAHRKPARPQNSPHAWSTLVYGAKTQYAPEPDTSEVLDATDIKLVQEVLGVLLYYSGLLFRSE
jgi:hypothetical protein